MENEHNFEQEESLQQDDASLADDKVILDENSNDNLEKQVQQCRQELSDWKDHYLRIAADFENFKKRQEKERTQTTRIIKGNVLFDFLSVVDNFERALMAEQKTDNSQALLQGFEIIYKEFTKLLEKHGIAPIVCSNAFDPELHEAVMNMPSSKHAPGEIVEVLQKGYTIDGQVLRPAKVSLAA